MITEAMLEDIKTLFGAGVFLLGMMTIVIGIARLLTREYHQTMRGLAMQSARIGQKALSENVAIVADSAARLMDSVNQMSRTAAGVGAFLTLLGVSLVALGYWIMTH